MAATGRHGSRRLLVQALYQYQLSEHSVAEIAAQFAAQRDFRLVDVDYFRLLLGEILGDTDALDRLLTAQADRPVAQLDPVERGILWLGLAELKLHREVPVKVVINEAVKLAHEFGAQDGHRYINAVLDQLAPALRPAA
ncbi:MAG: transcription antitermination factor NusB [Gammaproteobacteria bacterium]|nr:transcription antitermination factor NusB [Gammaproteobacteria bacterium]MCP5139045.1 transcription antitermination factor NusB [Chromatiales bacterium]